MQKLTIQIPKPCHERWEEMQHTERGRFCASCQKTVVDYSALSDEKLVRLLSRASGNVCGRLRDDQLNRSLPLVNPENMASWYRWVGMLTAALLSWKTSLAQFNSLGVPTVNSLRPEIAVSPIPIRGLGIETQWNISGRVMLAEASGTMTPAVNAYVTITGIGKGMCIKTDSLGKYTTAVSGQTRNTQLAILVNIPFCNQTITMVELTSSNTSVVVNDIVVSNVKLTSASVSTGGVVVVRTPSRWQKIRRKFIVNPF